MLSRTLTTTVRAARQLPSQTARRFKGTAATKPAIEECTREEALQARQEYHKDKNNFIFDGRPPPVDKVPDFHAYHSTFSPPFSKKTVNILAFICLGVSTVATFGVAEWQQRKNGFK